MHTRYRGHVYSLLHSKPYLYQQQRMHPHMYSLLHIIFYLYQQQRMHTMYPSHMYSLRFPMQGRSHSWQPLRISQQPSRSRTRSSLQCSPRMSSYPLPRIQRNRRLGSLAPPSRACLERPLARGTRPHAGIGYS